MERELGSMTLSGIPGSFEGTFSASSAGAASVLLPCAHSGARTAAHTRTTATILQMKPQCCGIFVGQILSQPNSDLVVALCNLEASVRPAGLGDGRFAHFAQKARVAYTQCTSGFSPVPMVCLKSPANDRLLELFG